MRKCVKNQENPIGFWTFSEIYKEMLNNSIEQHHTWVQENKKQYKEQVELDLSFLRTLNSVTIELNAKREQRELKLKESIERMKTVTIEHVNE